MTLTCGNGSYGGVRGTAGPLGAGDALEVGAGGVLPLLGQLLGAPGLAHRAFGGDPPLLGPLSSHFAAFTFVSPILQTIAGIDSGLIGPLLLTFGIAGIIGNFIVGSLVSRNLRGAVIAISLLLAAILALFPVVGGNAIGGVSLLILWGLAFGGVPVSAQTWILRAAPQSAEAATALNTSVFNLVIALGALFVRSTPACSAWV
ncbi:MFS transporter [Streptosporangium sp. CA-135522]|uniref:MFS transporter n=1 Tax=Streptosporangium sp. CA-135522 TaxID=3240072 RepID=UPI003D91724E